MADEGFKITIGKDIGNDQLFELDVELDVDQPDMAIVVLNNVQGENSSTIKESDAFVIKYGDVTLFDGEVSGIEPVFGHHNSSRVTIRGLNRMHRLARGRKSRTFEQMTDLQVVKEVCKDAELSVEADPGADATVKHDHLYQHSQTNLQLVREAAARNDAEIRVEGTKLFFQKRKLEDSGVEAHWGGDDEDKNILERFRPRLSTANQVTKVVVRGWDPIKKEEIVGEAKASSDLGSASGAEAAGDAETFHSDRSIHTKDQAQALAESILKKHQMGFIRGDALLHGTPETAKLKPRMTIKIDVQDPKFNGTYYITSCRHRYLHSVGGAGGAAGREAGYRAFLKVQRDGADDKQSSLGASLPGGDAPLAAGVPAAPVVPAMPVAPAIPEAPKMPEPPAALADAKQAAADAQAKADEAKAKADEAQSNVDKAKSAVDEAKAKADDAKGKVDEVGDKVDEAKGQVAEAQSKVDDAKALAEDPVAQAVNDVDANVDTGAGAVKDKLHDAAGDKVASKLDGVLDENADKVKDTTKKA